MIFILLSIFLNQMTRYNNNQLYNRYLLSFMISSYLSIKLISNTNVFELSTIIKYNKIDNNFGINKFDWELLTSYLIIDSLYPNNPTTLIHHIINLIAINFGNNYFYNHLSLFQEISTPFLCGRTIFPKKYQVIFNYFFIFTFFYFRIYLFNYLVFTHFFKVLNHDKILFLCGLTQCIINNYWFCLIIKKLV